MFSLLATTSADQSIKIWQTSDFTLKSTLKESEQRWVWDCAFSEDSQYLVAGRGTLSKNVKHHPPSTLKNHTSEYLVIFFLVSSDGIARLWSLEQEEVVRKYQGHKKALVSLAFRDVQV